MMEFFVIFRVWHFENGLGDAIYPQIVTVNIIICYKKDIIWS